MFSDHKRHGRRWLAVVVLVLAGCGGETLPISPISEPVDHFEVARHPGVAAAIPARVRKAGVLRVGTDPAYAPMEFVSRDGKTLLGMDVDLAKALSATAGLRVRFVRRQFSELLSATANGEVDVAISSITDTRKRERMVDLVTYFWAGTSFYALRDRHLPGFHGLRDICGLRVGVVAGSTQAEDADRQARRCKRQGETRPHVDRFASQPEIDDALRRQTVELTMTDSPIAGYIVDISEGEFRQLGADYGSAPMGIATAKDSGLAEPMLRALRALVRAGQYDGILAKWNLASGTVGRPRINGALR